jgi:hypothetical protein
MNRRVLEELANALVDAETLAGPELDAFLEGVQPWPHPLVQGLNGSAPTVVMRVAAEGSDGSDGTEGITQH